MKTMTTTFLVTLLIAAVPLGLLWKENASLRAQIAAQSLPASPPAAGEIANSDRRRPIRAAKTEKQAAQKSETGEIKWRSVLEDPDPVRRAGRFYTFVSNMTPESARAAAKSLEDMRNRNALSDGEWRHFPRLGWRGRKGRPGLLGCNTGDLTTNTNGPGGTLTFTQTGGSPRFVRLKVTPN